MLYISEGLTGNEASAVPSDQPIFDQKGCQYIPHVLAMDVDQKFQVITSDQTTHNIHPLPNPMTGNIPWNNSQPPGAPPIIRSWKAAEMIPVKCNIHPWMHGYFAVVKGPYATSDKNGSYTIHGVPAGSYTVTAWQEDLGTQTSKSYRGWRQSLQLRISLSRPNDSGQVRLARTEVHFVEQMNNCS